MNAKLIAFNVPASDPKTLQQFYSELLGIGLARSFNEEVDAYHAPVTNEGQYVWVSERNDPEEKITAVFAVDDLDSATQDVINAGAQQFGAPVDAEPLSPTLKGHWRKNATPGAPVTDSFGRIAYFRDPDQNVIALMEVAQQAHRSFKVGANAVQLSPETRKAQNEARKAGRQIEV